jgi:hypothetical protein
VYVGVLSLRAGDDIDLDVCHLLLMKRPYRRLIDEDFPRRLFDAKDTGRVGVEAPPGEEDL